jgi:hypothetical protein
MKNKMRTKALSVIAGCCDVATRSMRSHRDGHQRQIAQGGRPWSQYQEELQKIQPTSRVRRFK